MYENEFVVTKCGPEKGHWVKGQIICEEETNYFLNKRQISETNSEAASFLFSLKDVVDIFDLRIPK